MIYWFTDEFYLQLARQCKGYDILRTKPTSRLCAFVANKSSAFQAGFWRRFMPQNKFCGYENSAFQAKTPSNTGISITVEVFNSPAHFCLKGNNLHNRRSLTCGRRHPCNLSAWKTELLPLYKWISTPAKKEQTKRKFVILNSYFSTSHFSISC